MVGEVVTLMMDGLGWGLGGFVRGVASYTIGPKDRPSEPASTVAPPRHSIHAVLAARRQVVAGLRRHDEVGVTGESIIRLPVANMRASAGSVACGVPRPGRRR